MGQGFERLNNRKPDYSSRDKFFEGAKQIKSKVLIFFSFIQKNFIHHHHTKKAVHHIRKHHKKYIFGSTISFLLFKIIVTLLTTVGGGTLAQESNNQYLIGDGIISQYEQCDDQNLENGDGCNSAGQIEEGSTCIGEPSICSLYVQSPTDKGQPLNISKKGVGQTDSETSKETIITDPIDEIPTIQPIPDESSKKQSPKKLKNPDPESDNIDLINSLYGPSSQYISTRDSNKCNISDMNVVYLQPGENQIPNYLSANTIYALAPGSYSSKYMININFDCSALIGLDRGAILYTNNSKGATIKISSGSNTIIQNLILHGSQTIYGDLHSGNNYGIFIDSPYNTISNIKTYDNIGFSIYLENFDNDISNISKITENKIYKLIGAVNYPLIIPDTADIDIISQSLHNGEYILSGTTRRGFRPLNLALSSVLFQSMDMYSVDQSIKLSLPSNSQFILSGDIRFTGIFLSPKNISTPITQSQFTNEKVIYAFKLGIQDQVLYLHDLDNNPIKSQVSIDIPSSGDLSSLFVYYSQDGILRENIGPVKSSYKEDVLSINFKTDKFGLFAVAQLPPISTDTGSISTGDDFASSLQDQLDEIFSGFIDDNTGSTIQTGNINDNKIDGFTGGGESIFIGSGSQAKGKVKELIQNMEKKQKQEEEKQKKDKEKEKKDKKEKAKDKLKGKGYYENGPGKMIGDQPIDIGEIESETPTSIIMQSTGDDIKDIIEVELPEGIFIFTQDDQLYTGILDIPRLIDQENIDIKNFQAFKTVQILPDHPDLFFKDLDNNPAYVTIKIPTPDIPIGKLVVVNYSNDQINRHYLTDTVITGIDNNNFAVFQTDHFTTFSIGVYSGTFTINNDDVSTTSTGVTLNMNVSGVTYMRFGNTKYDRDSSAWIPYSSTHSRTLESKAGLQTVYAAFSGQLEIAFVEDDIIGSRDRNNDYFIDDYFWSTNPNSGDIKTALYGDGISNTDPTAYSKYWSGILCNPSTMNLIYVDSGVNTIPNTLSANTIYILNGGDYINTNTITAGGNCIAIVGKDRAKLFQTDSFSNGAIYASSRNNIIIDNIQIDSISNGTGGAHYSTPYGIYLRNVGNGHTVNNVSISNTRSYGIYLNTSTNNFFNNIKVYNANTDGIYTTSTARNNTIQNSQFFNNSRYGININSPTNKINNVQSYNNLYAGIIINGSASTNNVVNNLQTYNNAIYGIYLMSTSGTILNNISSYSNNLYGLYFNNITSHTKVNNISLFNNSKGYYSNNNIGQVENYYYGDIKVFGNNDDYFGDKIAMGGSEYSDIGRTTGFIYNTGEYGCDFVSKPDGFLYHPNDESCGFRGVDGSLNIDYLNHSYIYGSGLANQSKTITYSGDGLILDNLDYNPDHKIGQINSVNNIGYIKFKNNTYFTDITGVQLYFGYDQIGSEYIITGDFLGSPITGFSTSYSSKRDITLTSNTGHKNAYITFVSGSKSRTFLSSIEYIGAISDPIVEKYFGYNSFYTDNWEYGFCDPRNILVTTIDAGINTIPTPVANRIYILNSGNYISTGVKALLECGVLAGSGDVFHFTDITRSNATITANDRNTIVDNINFDGKNDGVGGVHNANSSAIYSNITSNLTINDVDIYNHSIGAYTLYNKNVLINNINSYNNYQGTSLSYGLRLHATANAVLNNIKSFNNYSENIHVNNLSSNISLNNIISFNSRRQGISVYNPSNLVLNNALLLNNNSNGIFSTSLQNPIINQVSAYNNVGGGISLNGSIKYYGSNQLFQNSNDSIDGFAGGIEFGYLGWSSGSLDSQGSINCTRVVNPQNADTSYLQTGELCDFRTYNPSISGYTIDYSYGANIPTQTQPVYFKNQEIIPSQILYYTGNYIAGPPIPIVTNYTLSYSAGPNGSISGDSLQTIQEGSHGSPVLAIADTGYYFVKRSDESTDNPRTDNYVIGNISVLAEFALIAPTAYHSGLVAYMPFDTDVSDYSIYSHTSSGFSTNSITGKINNAYNFDGSSSYVEIYNSPELNPIDQITLAARVKRDINPASGNNRASIINKNIDNQYRLQHDRYNTAFEFALRAPNSVWIDSTTVPVSGERYFVVGTYDGQELKLYVNGILENTGSNIGSIQTSTNSINIGRRSTADRHFDGNIDEVAIWNRALSSSEILGLYNNGSGLSLMTTNNEYILSYSAGPSGSISGDSLQTIQEGNNGSPVLAIADTGYNFIKRSDESTDNPRADLNVIDNISVFAEFGDNIPPSKVIITYPENNHLQNTGNINPVWQQSIDDGSGISGYIWEISNDNFLNIILSGFTAATQTQIEGLSSATYQLRVYAIDYSSNTGLYSDINTFTIDTTQPTASISYDPNITTNQNVTATLTGFSKTGIIITNNDGSPIYVFTGNGTFTFQFIDLAGNTGYQLASVDRIQLTAYHSITDITLDPSLNISRFAPYTLITQTSGDILSGEVNLSILDGDNNSCRNYYTDGTCDSQPMNFPLINSANNIRVKTGIYPDYIYPEIFFAPSDITRNNTPIETTINRNNYHIFKMDNPFTMVDEMSFWIEFNAVPNNLNSSSDLYVYIASNDQSLSNFQTDWRNNTNVELVGTLNKNNTFHHTHTSDSSHHLVALSTNSDGTIGNKNINISGQFWIILYQASPNTNRGWKLRYHDQSICTNTGSWYVSSAFATPISQSGCPDAHVHIARRNLNQDLLLADITMYYQDGENISQITGSNTFSFGEIPNMPPNQTSFINPLGLGVYNTAIDISWNPASDPNNDSLFYNLYLLSSTGTRLSTIVTGISTTGYLRDISTISDDTYGLELESCDPGLLCSYSYLDDNFFLDTSIPTIIFTGATPQDQSILTSNNFTTQLQIQDNLGLNQFSYIYDGTIYNIYDSGLLLMYNFDNISPLGENYTIAKDFSQYSNTGTIYGNPQHTSGVWNGSYSFDGSSNQYISIGDGVGIDIGTSHTISLRIKPNLLSGSVLGQMSGVSAIYISGSQIGYSNSPGNYTYFDVNMSSGQRNHIAISRDSTNISLYKNGLFVSTGILGDNIPLELFYIGKESDIGLNEKRFNGKIDELFIYNRSLSSGEISQIYRSNLSAVSDNKFIYTTDYSCIATGGIYYYSGIVYDNANNSNSLIQSNIINIPSPSLNIQASSIDMGQIQASMENSQTLSGQSDGNFSVSDWRGNTSWYTTISTPLNLIGNNNNSHVISGAQISFKSNGISTLSGFSTNLIYVVGNLSGYVNAPNAATYIKRDLPDIPFMCPGGVYGNRPWFKVEVPAGQAIDIYSGTITYDIVY